MSQFHLRLFGAPEIYYAGQPLKFPTRKTLALLIYLAVEGGLHTREKLATLLWPESDSTRSRATLRNTLSYLRSFLPKSAEQAFPLMIERDVIGFSSSSDVNVDLHVLRDALRATQTPDLPHYHVITQLQSAIALSQGDFLEGFSLSDAPAFDDWASVQREYWRRQVNIIFEHLVRIHTEGGESAAALEIATDWLTRFPLNEDACQRVMRLHFEAGDRTAALHVYETHKVMINKELDLQPEPALTALAERIRSAPPPPRTPSLALQPFHSLSAGSEGILVGRSNEYIKLTEAYHATAYQPQLVILEGPEGIGKTHLAMAFLRWARSQKADILQGKAFEVGGRLPYQVLVEALRTRVAHENAPDDLLSDIWLSELSRLLPDLRDRYPDLPLPPALSETEMRISLCEAIARFTQALAERGPLVIFVDDIQWADVASLDALRYIARYWQENNLPVLLLVCLRSEALLYTKGTHSVLFEWLTGLQHDLPAIRLPLGPLTAVDSMRLVQALVGKEPSHIQQPVPSNSGLVTIGQASYEQRLEQFHQWLFAETGGHPFFLLEMLKALSERGLLTVQPQRDGQRIIDFATIMNNEHALRSLLPSKLREVISTRLARLSTNALDLLVACATFGYNIIFELLCQVANLDENEGLRALDEVLQSSLLTEAEMVLRGKVLYTYTFTHDKIRDVVYMEAGDARRRIFHRRAMAALQAMGAPAAKVAYHALAAGQISSFFHCSLVAGDEAMHLSAVQDAIATYEQAQRMILEQRDGKNWQLEIPVSERCHLYLQLGRAYELNNELEKARTTYQAMLTFSQEQRQPTAECTALNRLATVTAHDSVNLTKAMQLLQQALLVAEDHHDMAGLAETEWNLALMHLYSFEWKIAQTYGEQALTRARSLDVPELYARCLNVIAHAEMGQGSWTQAETHAEEARTLFANQSNRAMEADCLSIIANARIHRGQLASGISAARAAHELSCKIANTWGQTLSAVYLTQGLLETGDYANALAIAQQSVAIARTLHFVPLLVLSLTMLGHVEQSLFQLKRARAAYLEALPLSEQLRLCPYTEAIAAALCMNAALSETWSEAHAYALQALKNRNYVIMLPTGISRWYETEAFLRAGDDEQAQEDLQRFGERAGKSTRFRISYLRASAIVAQWKGENTIALSSLSEAAILAEEIGLPGELWQIAAAQGELYLVQGDKDQAHDAFKRAATYVQTLADNIGDDTLRADFLASQPVRHVLERSL